MNETTSDGGRFDPRAAWAERLVLLCLILVSFTRLVWELGAKNLWLDESFSLQRAESSWPALIQGLLIITDGEHQIPTIDQHPFAYFAFLGAMVRAAGQSEFAIRFPSVIASTLMAPAAWALARRLERRAAVPPSAPLWIASLMALNPFYLWYGQEARIYALVALLSVLSTYVLLCWRDATRRRERHLLVAAYVFLMVALLSSNYFALLILPVHALLVYCSLMPVSRRRALIGVVSVLALGLVPALVALHLAQGVPRVSHLTAVSLRILIPDLISAFSMGLSVDLARVWGFDLVFAALALLGAIYGLSAAHRLHGGGWLLPALFVIPQVLLVAINLYRPAYINARHMSLISGFFIMLVGGGLAWVWQRQRWVGGALAVVLLAGTAYSTINYFTLPEYEKGRLSDMGAYLRQEVQPGDLLLWEPPPWWRLFRYYLPMDELSEAGQRGYGTAHHGMPFIGWPAEKMGQALETLIRGHRRIWVAQTEWDTEADRWLADNTLSVREMNFPSPITGLRLMLYLPSVPIIDRIPDDIQHSADVVWGDRIRFVGYDLGQPLAPGRSLPVTLYWQAMMPLDRRYKYILRLEADCAEPGKQVLALTEREPYDTGLPTTTWPPGSTIVEYSGVTLPEPGLSGGQPECLTLQVYDAETQEKLPVSRAEGATQASDGLTVILPYAP